MCYTIKYCNYITQAKEAFALKYWRGFLVALIFAIISWALTQFAAAHSALVDMVYPYMTRLVISSLADWSSVVSVCLWQVLLFLLIAGGIASIVLMIVLRWNPVQWLGWILAATCGISMFHTLLYGLNQYTGPIYEDVRLEMTDYTVSELNEAVLYFRDQANNLTATMPRDQKGNLKAPDFETLAQQAGEGFETLTYEDAISLFAGSTAPVKKLSGGRKGQSGITVALTGEAAVNPKVPSIALPFAMCKEMSHRMTIAREEEAKYAAYMACAANSSDLFRYSAYCIAYYHCYNTLLRVPSSTAQSCAQQANAGVNKNLRSDMEDYEAFFGKYKEPDGDSMADLLISWYIQEFITPLHLDEEDSFNPTDPSNVDLTYTAPTPTPLKTRNKQ